MFIAKDFVQNLSQIHPNQPEFLQAVSEVFVSLENYLNENRKYIDHAIPERIVEPDRIISFRVVWIDDEGKLQVNRGYRVQFNSSIGPYKGGLRFHPSVNLSILKFLGFEQTFKNSLTGLPMGGGKGGSDFDPRDKSDGEIMRFSQSFMNELYRHIGEGVDVPAGDIGVGSRELGFLFGQYRKIRNSFEGVLTGKGYGWGGSEIRPEATGYGLVYFVQEMLATQSESIEGKEVVISGSGNVAQFAAEKCIELGAKVLTMSDSDGVIFDKDGIDAEKLEFLKDLKNNKRGRIAQYVENFGSAKYLESQKPWGIPADIALPCATQNEIEVDDAKILVDKGIMLVAEGSNMPSSNEAIEFLQNSGVLFAPGKASNAGGVAVSGLEMSQNSLKLQWSREEVDSQLKGIMRNIHKKCLEFGETDKSTNYVVGANIAGFIKVADAMIDQGV